LVTGIAGGVGREHPLALGDSGEWA
jgi:hypothetical protein